MEVSIKVVLLCQFKLILQTCDIDLDQEVEEINQSEPYIIVTGRPGEETSQYFISAENAITTESKTFRDALVDVISTYYVFDITYPKSVCGLFLFFQQSVFGVKDSQHHPSCLSKLVQNIQAI